MSLFDRITIPGPTKIAVHELSAALTEWATGGVTRQQVIDEFTLTGDDVTNLDAIQATYSALTDAFLKAEYLVRMLNVFILVEAGVYPEAKAKSRLGF